MRALVVAAALCLFACSGVPALNASTFEGDADGWTLSGNGDVTTPRLERSGGNPGGHICGQDAKDGDNWYFVAPQRYLGNATAAYGKRLTFDLKQGSIFNQIRGRDVVMNGGGLSVAFHFRQSPGLDWTPVSVSVDDTSGWLLEATGQPATSEELNTVLRNLTSLRLRGEFYDGPNDTACLDNVYFGTP